MSDANILDRDIEHIGHTSFLDQQALILFFWEQKGESNLFIFIELIDSIKPDTRVSVVSGFLK